MIPIEERIVIVMNNPLFACFTSCGLTSTGWDPSSATGYKTESNILRKQYFYIVYLTGPIDLTNPCKIVVFMGILKY